MSNYYSSATAYESVPCSRKNYDMLLQALSQPEDIYHGFDVEFSNGSLYLFASEYANPNALHDDALKQLGIILKAAKKPWLKVGVAMYGDRQHEGSCSGYDFKISAEGKLIYPTTTWPTGFQDEC